MAEQQPTARTVFFQPLPEHDTLNIAYLLAKVSEHVTVTPSGCWEWTGNKLKHGYGRVDVGGKKRVLHRLIYSLCVAPVSCRMQVCHSCDNPPCCNPAHLFLGTNSDNQKDSVAKGRNVTPDLRGEDHPAAKLSEEAVRDIRRRAASGGRGIKKQLAEEHCVSQATISEILSGKKWGHVE